MDNQLILIADSDAKNLQILKDNLEASGFLVTTVSNGKSAWEEILRTPPKLIISETNLPGLSGYQLLERINGDQKTSSIPLVFLTKQREVQQRIKGFEMGAKDYLVKPLHVKEVIAHVRMVLRRIEQRKIDQIETYKKFSGKLEQLALADLIENFGIERKTGILTVSNGKRTGQVFFREGSVVNANLEDFKTEQAIYQMLPWENGYFNMIFRDVDVADNISISNLGLLLQGIKRLEIREKLINQLPSSKTAFTVSPTFKVLLGKKKVGNGASGFITLLDGYRNIQQIIDESKLDDLIALKRLVRLYQQGFIKPTIAAKKQAAPLSNIIEPAEKVTFIKKHKIPLEIKLDEENIFALKPQRTGNEIDTSKDTPLEESLETIELQSENIAPARGSDQEIEATENKQSPPVFDEKISADNVFQIKPKRNQEDLENEIIPLIERIEKESKNSTHQAEAIDKQTEEPTITDPEPDVLTDVETSTPAKDFETNRIEDTNFTFIDEELLKQSSMQTKLEQPEPVELEKQDKSIAELEHKSERPVVSTLTSEQNKIVLISIDDDCKDEIMDILTNDNFRSLNISPTDSLKIDLGKVHFKKYSRFNLIAASVEKKLNSFLRSVKQSVAGNIFVFDCSQPETWEYTSYLIHSIWFKFRIPYVVAIMNFKEQTSITKEVIRYKLDLKDYITMVTWDEIDESDPEKLLEAVVTSTHPESLDASTAPEVSSI